MNHFSWYFLRNLFEWTFSDLFLPHQQNIRLLETFDIFYDNYSSWHQNRGNISSRFSSNSEANASELLEKCTRNLSWYYIYNDVSEGSNILPHKHMLPHDTTQQEVYDFFSRWFESIHIHLSRLFWISHNKSTSVTLLFKSWKNVKWPFFNCVFWLL